MDLKKVFFACSLVGSFFLTPFTTANAEFIDLDNPNCGFQAGADCLVFDDFTVYSMAFLQYNETGDLKVNSGDEFYVPSSPGKLADDIVIATSPAAAASNQDIAPGASDDAYDTPNMAPNSTASVNFDLAYMDDPIADFSGDGDNAQPGQNDNGTLWDITTTALTDFLDGDDLMFFFNLNEMGTNDQLDAGQEMLVWAEVFLTEFNDDGSIFSEVSFVLSGNAAFDELTSCGTPPCADPRLATQFMNQTTGVDDILPNTTDMWAHVHGEVCVDSTNGEVLALGSCSAAGHPTNGVSVDQNLGAKNAAFGIYSKDLNTALDSGIYDVMSVDFKMSHIDNGYEQLFIRAASTANIPEPGTIFIIGLGLIGIGFSRKKMKA